MKPLVAVATSTLLALSGVIACAPLSKDQCQAANWQQIGYQNGLKGRDAARFEEERRACAEHGLGADATGWKLGYAQGLGLYCRPEHGYDIGRRGESYGDVCPPDLDAQFRPAYEDGRQIAAIVSALDQRRTQRNDIAQRLAEDDRRARDYVEQIREGREPPPEPPQLLDKRERRELENVLRQLSREFAAIREDFERRDSELSARYAVPVMAYDADR